MTRVPQAYRNRTDKSSRRLGLALAIALASAGTAAAHPGHEGGLYAALVGVDEAPAGAVGLRVLIVNNTPGAATLHRLAATGSGRIAIARNRSLFGLSLSQRIESLSLESGERRLLAAPDYAVTAEGVDIDAVIRGEVVLLADFGELGVFVLEVVGAPPPARE
jgi:hypothetical protein